MHNHIATTCMINCVCSQINTYHCYIINYNQSVPVYSQVLTLSLIKLWYHYFAHNYNINKIFQVASLAIKLTLANILLTM